MRVLITGGTGFIGNAAWHRLSQERRHSVRVASRRSPAQASSAVEWVTVTDLGPDLDWRQALEGVDVVIHTAGRAHIMRDNAADPLAAFRQANVAGSTALAVQAAEAGVQRLIFLSTIKVHGEFTPPGRAFRADDLPAPADPYALSKWEAEQQLQQVAASSALELVIIRLPLVYGPGVKANFSTMLQWLNLGVPLPLGAVRNRRTLLGLDNLLDLLLHSMQHPAAPGGVLLAGDRETVSTAELLQRLGSALGRPARLLPLPPALLKAAASCTGRQAMMARLLGSLEVDIGATCDRLGWQPPSSLDQELARTATAFLAAREAGAA